MHHFTCIFMTPPLPCLWRSTSSTSLSNTHCSSPCRVAGSLLHSFSRVLRWLPWELLRFSSSFLERILVAVTAAGIGSGWTRTAEWWILTTSLSVIGLYLRRRLLPFAGPVLRSSRYGVFRSLFHFHCSSGSSEVDDVWFGTLWIKKNWIFLIILNLVPLDVDPNIRIRSTVELWAECDMLITKALLFDFNFNWFDVSILWNYIELCALKGC